MTNEPEENGAPEAGAAAAAAGLSLEGTIWPQLDRALSGITARGERAALDVIVHIPRDEVVWGLRALKTDANVAFDYLRCLTCVDNEEEGMDVVYMLYSTQHRYNVTVKTHLAPDDLNVDTATTVWRAANWYEREAMEMFGVRFRNHPDPRTLLMPEDMTDTFPLRKDHPLAEIEVIQGEGIAWPGDEPFGVGGGWPGAVR
jgi:NADH-quinone oxidoreductase subunit C